MKQRRYNLFLTCTLLFVFLNAGNVFTQWEKIANYDVGPGGIVAHGSTVFLSGSDSHGKKFVYRSSDNGATWTNIADKFPDLPIAIHGHGSYVFAIGLGFFYYSTDDGVTWSSKSTSGVPNNVAFIDLISDGSTLYGLSNRSIVVKSTDNGSTWTQININYTQANVLGIDFAASGNKMVFCALNLGSFISTDGGTNWILKNPVFIIGSVLSFNNEFYGSTLGMYKLVADTGWAPIHNGFPSGIGISGGTKSTVSVGSKLFTYYNDVIVGAKVFTSEDNGNNWSEVGNNLPSASSYSLNKILAVTPQYLYCYIFSIFSPGNNGVYRYPLQATSLENADNSVPSSFNLSQNYPNPFNPSTTIKFSVPKSSFVTLKVYDVLGKEVAQLVNENLNAGTYNYNFDAAKLTSGVYFYRIQSDNFTETKKMILTK